MMFMTAKVNIKKLLIIAAAVVAVILALVLLFGGSVGSAAWIAMLILFLSGVQVSCIGLVGSYIGKTYLEVKARPRYIISQRTEEKD